LGVEWVLVVFGPSIGAYLDAEAPRLVGLGLGVVVVFTEGADWAGEELEIVPVVAGVVVYDHAFPVADHALGFA